MFRSIFFFILVGQALLLEAAMIDPIQQPDMTISIVTSPAGLITGIIKYGIGIAGILGVIGITWGGIQMILSVGEDEKQKKARYTLIYSVLGVIIAGLAYSVVNILSSVKL